MPNLSSISPNGELLGIMPWSARLRKCEMEGAVLPKKGDAHSFDDPASPL
jgi:hypothetical protein